MQHYMLILNNKCKHIKMSPSATSEDFANEYKKFAKEISHLEDWFDVYAFRLYENQKIGKVYYEESFSVNGAHFTLLKTRTILDEEIEEAENYLYTNRDVVSINLIKARLIS